MKDWEVTGTPFLAILQPDGYVAWNQYENNGERYRICYAKALR